MDVVTNLETQSRDHYCRAVLSAKEVLRSLGRDNFMVCAPTIKEIEFMASMHSAKSLGNWSFLLLWRLTGAGKQEVSSPCLCLLVSCQWLSLSEFNKKPVARESGKCDLQTPNSSIIEQIMEWWWVWAERQLVNNLSQAF